MKPNEALEILKHQLACERDEGCEKYKYCSDCPNCVSDNEFMGALDAAISALEFRTNYDKFWEEVKAEGARGREVEIHHSGRAFRIREVAQ